MGERENLRRDVASGPARTGWHLEANEGVDRLVRAVFAEPSPGPSHRLRQGLRQRIAHEDSLWRPLEHLGRHQGSGSASFFTLPLQGPAKDRRRSEYKSAYPPEAQT